MSDVTLLADSRSECSHTPGPWTAEAIVGDNQHDICGPSRPGEACPNLLASVAYDEDDPLPHLSLAEANANARLIAAAPALLDALKDLVQWQDEMKNAVPRIYLDRAKRAIAKAEGCS